MDRTLRGALIAILIVLTGSGCGGDDGAATQTIAPPPATPALSTPLTPALTQPGIVASVSPSPGRLAPDANATPLAFTQVRVFADPASGVFALHTNVTNTGTTFLNDVTFTWRIVDSSDAVLDTGDARIPTLAPSETTAVVLTGTRPFDEAWTAVQFTHPAVTP